MTYVDGHSGKNRNWAKTISVVGDAATGRINTMVPQAKYTYKNVLKVIDLERDVSPLILKETSAFWNASWQIIGLWPFENIRVWLHGDKENFIRILSATSLGLCSISVSAFEPYLLKKESR